MKRIVFGIAFTACCLTVIFNFNLTHRADGCNEAMNIANIEALAQGESGNGGECWGTGSVVCGNGTYYGKWF